MWVGERPNSSQPPHWLAEVAAVIARLRPEIADQAIDLLDALELAVEADAQIYKRASRIATQLNTTCTTRFIMHWRWSAGARCNAGERRRPVRAQGRRARQCRIAGAMGLAAGGAEAMSTLRRSRLQRSGRTQANGGLYMTRVTHSVAARGAGHNVKAVQVDFLLGAG
jgi:hypothetical protein